MPHPPVTHEQYPGVLYTLAAAGYRREALSLADAWGGNDHDIPAAARLHRGSALVQIIGMAAARVLADRYGPGRIYVPRAAGRGSRMRDILAHGGGTAETARAVGSTTSWVRRVRAMAREGNPADAAQPSLFDAVERE